MEDVSKWKATELRQFLLYTGPFILKKILPLQMYENFILLHISTRILISPKLHIEKINDAEEYLKQFVISFENIYGKHLVSYNVHNLLRISNDVRKFGTLDTFSAFKYENYYMKSIKALIRKADRPLQQLCKRYAELQACEDIKIKKYYTYLNNNNFMEYIARDLTFMVITILNIRKYFLKTVFLQRKVLTTAVF